MDLVMRVEDFLIDVIKQNKTTTYGAVCNAFGLPPLDGAWNAHRLCMIFDQIDRRDAAHSRPFKTAVVLNLADGKVGAGFFEALARYKNISALNADAKLSAWSKELIDCYAYPW